MKKHSNIYVLETCDLKILQTISLLNEKNIYPLSEGVYKILHGSEDEDIFPYRELSTYKTLVSFSQKKISNLIVMLIRYRYLERIFDEKSQELYLKVTDKGEKALFDYRKKHKYKFVTKKVKTKPLFATIK